MIYELEGLYHCKVCLAVWGKFRAVGAHRHNPALMSWSLLQKKCGKCCDNVAMGEQIERLHMGNGTKIPSNEGLAKMKDAATRLGWEPRDSVNINCTIEFGWLDRLRLLFHGKVTVHTSAFTEQQTGLTAADETYIHVAPIFRPRLRHGDMGGVVTAGEPADRSAP